MATIVGMTKFYSKLLTRPKVRPVGKLQSSSSVRDGGVVEVLGWTWSGSFTLESSRGHIFSSFWAIAASAGVQASLLPPGVLFGGRGEGAI